MWGRPGGESEGDSHPDSHLIQDVIWTLPTLKGITLLP